MLPELQLDSERYDEIIEHAKNRIVSIYPRWTDFNYHDPGVTMLELFSLMKESQQYYLNKIGPENRQRYLKLLGVLRRHKEPASADVTLRCGVDMAVAEGTTFWAGELPFEACARTCIPAARLVCCVSDIGGSLTVIGESELSFGGNLRLKPFSGQNPADGAFYIGFDRPLIENELLELYIRPEDDGGVPRNPVGDGDDFLSLADMTAEYFDGAVWRDAEIVRDTTFAFLLPGRLSFRLPGAMASTAVGGREAYFLRLRITGGAYDTQPSIAALEFGYVTVRQQQTRSVCADFPAGDSFRQSSVLALMGRTRIFSRDEEGLFTEISSFAREIDPDTGEVTFSGFSVPGCTGLRAVNMRNDFYSDGAFGTGTGLPYQEYDLGTTAIEYDSFALMTVLPGSGGRYTAWTKVRDFSRSGPADFHYILDCERGILRFGDCIRGAAPEGTILITGCRVTAGAAGNIAAGKLNRIEGFDDGSVIIESSRPAAGGRDEESAEEALSRAHGLLNTTETMITAEDWETRIRETPGLRIEKCQVVTMNASGGRTPDLVTSVVVKPYTANGRGVPGTRYVENILRHAEKYRMMGTRLAVIAPEYAEISVFADVNVTFGSTNARALITEAVEAYFESIRDVFGGSVSYSTLYGILDRLACVQSVNTLSLETSGSGITRTREGDLALAPNVTAVLSGIEIVTGTAY